MKNTDTSYPGQDWFVRNLDWGRCVPDKSNRGLGSMSRCSAQILICFIAYIFHFYSSVGLVGTLQDCHHAQCPLPLSIVIKMGMVIGQSYIPACLAEVQPWWKHFVAFMPQDWLNWQIKWMKFVSMGSFQYKSQSSFCILLYFSPKSRLIAGMLELGQVWLFSKLIMSRIWQLHIAVKLEFESILQEIQH